MGKHDQGRLESNLVRSGLVDVGKPEPAPFSGKTLLGQCHASRRLVVRDLAVLSWLCERFVWPPHNDPNRLIETTLYDLGQAIYGSVPDGDDRNRLHESLDRLAEATITMDGYNAVLGRSEEEALSKANLLDSVKYSPERHLRLVDPHRTGGLRNSTVHVRLTYWLGQQILAGYFTYLDLGTLRKLRGLAARLWVFLEGEQYKPTNGGLLQTWVGLGRPALASLGLDGYTRPRKAREALKRAGERICTVDERYESITVERRPGGWALVASRLSEERKRVRAQARESLDQGRKARES